MRRGDFQLREEIADQVKALQEMKVMAQSYGYDISKPAKKCKRGCSVAVLLDILQQSRPRMVLQ